MRLSKLVYYNISIKLYIVKKMVEVGGFIGNTKKIMVTLKNVMTLKDKE